MVTPCGVRVPRQVLTEFYNYASEAMGMDVDEVTENARVLPKSNRSFTEEALRLTLQTRYTLENSLHKMTGAKVVVADYAALLVDFGSEAICGHPLVCSEEQMDRYVRSV